VFLAVCCTCQPAWGQQDSGDLTSKSLEDLMDMTVTSVSKKQQKLSRTAAAVFVITQEDIRRSGATNIPDLLRMVPGVDVAQISANTWAITARGLNGQFSNELLVLLDGRNVYTPTFGGVFWETFDLPLENIERIEVIRGPGGSVWGANAVNGVVSIITKKAGETEGAMVKGGGGNTHGFGTVEYGGHARLHTDYRIYSKYFNDQQWPSLSGQAGGDGWHLLRGGFRADSRLSEKDSLAVSGDVYAGREGNPTTVLPSVTSPGQVDKQIFINLSGRFLQSTWDHHISDRVDTRLLVSYDTYNRRDLLGDKRKTFNADFQSHLVLGKKHDLVWGIVYRYSAEQSEGSLSVSLNPADQHLNIFDGFVQDEISLIRERLYVTVGTKLENNTYSGFGTMPSVRSVYEISKQSTLWGAVSRARRTPADTDVSIRQNVSGVTQPDGTPALIALLGNPHFKDEGLTAYEVGYRAALESALTLDVAGYYNAYDHQQTVEPAAPFFEATPSPPHLVLPHRFENLMSGEEYGIEISANWKVNDRWTINPGYDFARIHLHGDAFSQDTEDGPNVEGSDPHMHAQIRSHVDLSPAWGWDTSAYFTDRLIFHGVPAYTRVDTGLSWHWMENVSVSVFGQNLVKDHHLEFIDDNGATRSTLVKRSAYAQITWRF
jgi:iron complex outermembrane receptor protein